MVAVMQASAWSVQQLGAHSTVFRDILPCSLPATVREIEGCWRRQRLPHFCVPCMGTRRRSCSFQCDGLVRRPIRRRRWCVPRHWSRLVGGVIWHWRRLSSVQSANAIDAVTASMWCRRVCRPVGLISR